MLTFENIKPKKEHPIGRSSLLLPIKLPPYTTNATRSNARSRRYKKQDTSCKSIEAKYFKLPSLIISINHFIAIYVMMMVTIKDMIYGKTKVLSTGSFLKSEITRTSPPKLECKA